MRGPRHHPTIALLAPALGFAALLFVGPFLWLIWLSLTDRSFAAAERTGASVGLANYGRALSDDAVFLQSVGRSLAFTVLCLVPELGIALALAEFLYRQPAVRRYLVPLLALPTLLPSVATGLYWRILLQGEFGLVSFVLAAVGVESGRALLSNPRTIIFTLAAVDVWQWAPFAALLLFAVRVAFPATYTEAAMLDGASSWQIFRDVTLPLLRPAIVVIALVRAGDIFKEFDKVFVLTGGGPGTASEFVSLYLWRAAFRYWDFGYAAALSILVYALLYGAVVSTVRFTKTKGTAG